VPTDSQPSSRDPDRQALWETLTSAYRAAAGVLDRPAPGSDARTDAARRDTEARVQSAEHSTVRVDLYVDPVCPYTWLAACWLREVERHRDLDLQLHPMSLRMLNEHRVVDDGYRASIESSAGPSRVGTAVWVHHGADAFRAWHTSFGSMIFDNWRYPTPEEYRTAAARALRDHGLPARLVHAADTAEYDEPLRRSHMQGTVPVGPDCGTPVIHLAGVAYFGPVLNAIPTTKEALDLFDGFGLLASCRDFFEVKRTRTSPPIFEGSAHEVCEIPKRGKGA
jgi:hypothetical protein